MEWILSCFADIHDWVPGKVSICKRFQDNNKLLEFCGRSNKVGVFVVIAEYFGRARQGGVMIPASSNRAGWSLFQREMRNFSLVLNQFLWLKHPPKMVVVEVVNLVVVIGVGKLSAV